MGSPALTAADVKARLEGSPGFAGTLGLTVLSSSATGAVTRMDAGPHLHNHVGGPHAAAIFGQGELTAFAVLLHAFGDLVEQGVVPLVRDGAVAYRDVATGPLLAEAVPRGDAARTREVLAERGRARFEVEVVFRRERDGGETGRCTYTMALLRP